jgi:hypothetical protein
MPVRVNDAARNAAVDAVVGQIDAGTATPGVLRIYTGTQPATPATSPSGTLLAEFDLSDPSFAAAASGSAALDVTPALATTGLAAGDAGYARFLTGDEAASTGLGVVDGTVATSGAMVNLNTVTISVGVNVEITSGSISLPASA